VRNQELLVDLDADAGLVERADVSVLADFPRRAAQLVAELVGLGEIALEVAGVVDGARKWMLTA
jgi:hypothetical protein